MIKEFGFRGISEVIATTISESGEPNAAPIGIISDGNLSARIYTNTQTYANIKATKKMVANIVDDPLLFVSSALMHPFQDEIRMDGGYPVLKAAKAWIVFECSIVNDPKCATVILRPLKKKILKRSVQPVNRGFNAVIEATIYATRYLAMKDPKYLRWIEHCEEIVVKCGGEREKEAMCKLKEFLGADEENCG
ncbi:MAG: DUF447 family protein [Methanocellales archaeon]|nr:DUF447 family protein [Methanocellales archaeon]MDD3292238.1 DUF447 family protein [Methanocellales archaeon]MDD5234776.1 DUF447 family protein [Methanocellales archaeon]MDD5484854.1 DUF447 family protein [Methanocellales archaeon]